MLIFWIRAARGLAQLLQLMLMLLFVVLKEEGGAPAC
jgi:hypothetical protein